MAETPKDVFLNSLLLDGSDGLKAQLTENMVGATLKRTTDGAPTLEIEVWDKNLVLLDSNILNSRITAQLQILPTDKIRSFELADIKKNDENLTLVLEDLAVAEMRRHDEPRKFAAGTVTRVQAAQILLDEIGWIPMVVGSAVPTAVNLPVSFVTPGNHPGLLKQGNIDIAHRPRVKNADGSISTVRSITIVVDNDQAVLIPTVVGNAVVSNNEAISHYRTTGENLGLFIDEDSANDYAENLHEEQAAGLSTGSAQLIKVELARGQLTAVPKDKSATVAVDESYFDGGSSSASVSTKKQTEVKNENKEDTWTAIKRWFSEINWTCYVDDGVLNVGPDAAYIAGDPVFKVTDGLPSLTSYVNFDWDIGKPIATAEYSVATDTFAAAPGTCIELYGLGPANGKWFISESSRNIFTSFTDISLKTPTPELPEPEETASATGTGAVDDGYFNSGAVDDLVKKLTGAITGTGSGAGDPAVTTWIWPTSGSHHINSNFGPRVAPGPNASTYHRGIDIAADLNQSVLAARDGVVTYAGPMSGYGNVVIIDHSEYVTGSGVQTVAQTRYGHLNVVSVRRGLTLDAGQLVGLAGKTGNATGVCIHFEIRKGSEPFPDSSAVDPYLILVTGK